MELHSVRIQETWGERPSSLAQKELQQCVISFLLHTKIVGLVHLFLTSVHVKLQ